MSMDWDPDFFSPAAGCLECPNDKKTPFLAFLESLFCVCFFFSEMITLFLKNANWISKTLTIRLKNLKFLETEA